MIDSRNKLNELSAKEWVARTVSVMVQKGLGRDSTGAKYEKQHPAPFSFQDVARFVEFFTKSGELVLDPFVGVGSSLKACALLGRDSIGVELNAKFASLAKERLKVEVGTKILSSVRCDVLKGDVRRVLKSIEDETVHLIVTSPPYWGILNKVDHKARRERIDKGLTHNYGSDVKDLALIARYDDFVLELASVFLSLASKLLPKRYAVIIVSDFRHKDRYYALHSDLAHALESSGAYVLKGITILYQKFKSVFPYGYPYAFVPNVHHQYALILQRV